MPPPKDDIPPPHEITRQLERMLGSERFTSSPNQSAFLVFVVNRDMEGEKSTENDIGYELFPEKFIPQISTDVRSTASNLRISLNKYYAEEGRRDPIVIAVPKPSETKKFKALTGKAYKPEYRYTRIILPSKTIAVQFSIWGSVCQGMTV